VGHRKKLAKQVVSSGAPRKFHKLSIVVQQLSNIWKLQHRFHYTAPAYIDSLKKIHYYFLFYPTY